MASSDFITPENYIRSGAYKKIQVSGIERKLSDLEKAVVGYISVQKPVKISQKARWSPLSYQISRIVPNLPESVKKVKEEDLLELIFEFYKQVNPDKLEKILSRTIALLETRAAKFGSWPIKNEYCLSNERNSKKLANYFKELISADLSDVKYLDFLGYPAETKTAYFNPKEKRETPFGWHSLKILGKMVNSRLLAKYLDGFSNYIVSPYLEVSGVKHKATK